MSQIPVAMKACKTSSASVKLNSFVGYVDSIRAVLHAKAKTMQSPESGSKMFLSKCHHSDSSVPILPAVQPQTRYRDATVASTHLTRRDNEA